MGGGAAGTFGVEGELRRLTRILLRRTKNNPVLIGESGGCLWVVCCVCVCGGGGDPGEGGGAVDRGGGCMLVRAGRSTTLEGGGV